LAAEGGHETLAAKRSFKPSARAFATNTIALYPEQAAR